MTRASRPVTERMITAAGIRPGMRVLDLASGVGDPSLTIARAVGPSGSVLGMDITAAMLDAAREFAREQGLANVEYRPIASETDLGVEPASFDAATCRWGLMFMPDPVAALRQLWSALRPGGRVAVATWATEERVPFMNLASDILRRHVTLPPPPPGPNQFSLPTAEAVAGILTAAGFAGASVESVEPVFFSGPDAASVWSQISENSGPATKMLAELSPEQRDAIRADAIDRIQARFGNGPITVGGEALVGSAAKPG